jgi:hypothetical protein
MIIPIIKIFSRNMPGWLTKTTENPELESVSMTGNSAEIPTEHLPSTSLEGYPYTSQLDVSYG